MDLSKYFLRGGGRSSKDYMRLQGWGDTPKDYIGLQGEGSIWFNPSIDKISKKIQIILMKIIFLS